MTALSRNGLIATSLGLALSGLFVGVGASLSYITVPAVLLRPPPSATPATANNKPAAKLDHVARQYLKVFDLGASAGPVVGGLSAACFLTAFRSLPAAAPPLQGRLFIAAAILNVAIAPFTFTVMKRTNDELHRRAHAATDGQDERDGRRGAAKGSVESYETDDLLVWWAHLNMMRAVLHIGSVVCGITALVM